MFVSTEPSQKGPTGPRRLAGLERHLTWFLLLRMVVGIAVGRTFPALTSWLGPLELPRGSHRHAPIGAGKFFEPVGAVPFSLFGPPSGATLVRVAS